MIAHVWRLDSSPTRINDPYTALRKDAEAKKGLYPPGLFVDPNITLKTREREFQLFTIEGAGREVLLMLGPSLPLNVDGDYAGQSFQDKCFETVEFSVLREKEQRCRFQPIGNGTVHFTLTRKRRTAIFTISCIPSLLAAFGKRSEEGSLELVSALQEALECDIEITGTWTFGLTREMKERFYGPLNQSLAGVVLT